jgi:hypothetical protein
MFVAENVWFVTMPGEPIKHYAGFFGGCMTLGIRLCIVPSLGYLKHEDVL